MYVCGGVFYRVCVFKQQAEKDNEQRKKAASKSSEEGPVSPSPSKASPQKVRDDPRYPSHASKRSLP